MGRTGKQPRLIYLSQLFDPEPTFKGHGFIERLEADGFDIEVVTGFPNYPGGQVYDGYRIAPLKRERMGQTDVTRLAMYPSHDHSALRRIMTYTSFMITAFFYLLFRARKADLIYIYYPALTAGLAAAMAKIFRRTPMVLDVQDMWPDSLGSSGMMRNPVLLKLAHFLTNWVYRMSDHIVVLSPGFKALLIERGVPSEKISIIYNWAEETPLAIENAPGSEQDISYLKTPEGFDENDTFRVVFAGNMGKAQDLGTIINAATELQNEGTDCTFYLMGDGVERDTLEAQVIEQNLRNVRFLPRVPLAQVQQFLLAADALLVHLTDNELFRITIPSKTQAYLYAGRPILMGVAGDASDLVKDAKAGHVFAPGNARELAEKIRLLMAASSKDRVQIGRNGKEFYEHHLRCELGIEATLKTIDRFRRQR